MSFFTAQILRRGRGRRQGRVGAGGGPPGLSGDGQLDDLSPRSGWCQVKPRDRDREAEAAGPGAPGIEEQESRPALDSGAMRVTRDDDAHVRDRRVLGELLEVVDNPDERSADLHLRDFRKRGGPRIAIVVAAYCDEGRHAAERVENLGAADVARVDDRVHALERRDRLGPQETVGVRNDAHDWATGSASAAYPPHGRRV